MNSAVIIKIEYMFPGDEEFTELVFVPETGKISQEPRRTAAGLIYTTSLEFLIAGIGSDASSEINELNKRRVTFKATDADDVIYTLGDSNIRSRFLGVTDLGGTPGAFKGYRCTVTYNSTSGCLVEN